jgi:hypothetical protein
MSEQVIIEGKVLHWALTHEVHFIDGAGEWRSRCFLEPDQLIILVDD